MEERHVGELWTVGRLREELARFPDETKLAVASDEEQNGYYLFLQVDGYVGGMAIIVPTGNATEVVLTDG